MYNFQIGANRGKGGRSRVEVQAPPTFRAKVCDSSDANDAVRMVAKDVLSIGRQFDGLDETNREVAWAMPRRGSVW